MPLTPAERKRKQREKLKASGMLEDLKKKEAEQKRQRRQLIKQTASESKLLELRKKKAEEMKKYRQNKKKKIILETAGTPASEETPAKAFTTRSSYGKAIARVKRILPLSPKKRKAVVQTLARQIAPDIVTPKRKKSKKKISDDTLQKVGDFYVRDDISRQSPGIKDTIIVRLEDRKKVKMQTRSLYSSILETYALFCEEFGVIIGRSKFAELRPKHVLLSCQTPENVCLCKYHENYILAVNVLAKNSNDIIPSYSKDFLTKLALCESPTASCWYEKCADCKTMLKFKLEEATSFNKDNEVSWYEWKDEDRKVLLKGNMSTLREHILKMTPAFKEHSYVKRNQAQSYNNDRSDSLSPGCIFALLQVDFAENYTCVSQDEIQSYHWVKPQVSLLTASLWFHQKQHACVIASDSLQHNKDTVVAYIDKLLQEIPKDVKEVRIWSDGPASQFKNRFIANCLPILEKRYNLKISWNFFATSHGKGPVDGIGGAVKRQVRNSVMRREKIVNNAVTFAEAVSEQSKVKVILMNDEDFCKINEELSLTTVFEKAVVIKNIKKMHKIYVNHFNFVKALQLSCLQKSTYEEVYSDDSAEENAVNPTPLNEKENYDAVSEPGPSFALTRLELTPNNVQNGVFVLAQFATKNKRQTYRYVTICQSSVDEEGEVKLMSLKMTDNDASLFRADETDISYVSFEDILEILPNPTLTLKGNRIYYKFHKNLDIFENS